jgi:hypothetical protein
MPTYIGQFPHFSKEKIQNQDLWVWFGLILEGANQNT